MNETPRLFRSRGRYYAGRAVVAGDGVRAACEDDVKNPLRKWLPPKSHVKPGDLCWIKTNAAVPVEWLHLRGRECTVLSDLRQCRFRDGIKWAHEIEIIGDIFAEAIPEILVKQPPPGNRASWGDCIWKPNEENRTHERAGSKSRTETA